MQQQFQHYILHNNETILSEMTPDRMMIYQNSYYERIIAALKQDFPRLCDEIGDSAFASLIQDYLKSYPSKHYNLRIIGKNLSEFILSRDAGFAYYAELAKTVGSWEFGVGSSEAKRL